MTARIHTILIVDDSESMRLLISKMIKTKFPTARILEVNNGHDAINQYSKETPDLVTIDVGIPDPNGLEVLRSIKEINPNANVIMISAETEKEIINDAMSDGAINYLLKPFDLNAASRMISQILEPKTGILN